MVATRPDICYTVTKLSQDLTKPNSFHLMKAKRYLKSTINQSINQSLIFKKLQKPLKLGFGDTDWVNLSDRKIVGRFCFR